MPIVTGATEYGYRSVFTEPIDLPQMHSWFEDLKAAVAGRDTFCQLIDIRNQDDPARMNERKARIAEAMVWVKEHGLLRSAVVCPNAHVALKIKQFAFGTAVYEWERYFDGSRPGWRPRALEWLSHAVDPDGA
jgi:hypothetical protein